MFSCDSEPKALKSNFHCVENKELLILYNWEEWLYLVFFFYFS